MERKNSMSKIIDDKKEVELETKSKDLARHIRMCSNLLMKKITD